jgi:hypothetical protein
MPVSRLWPLVTLSLLALLLVLMSLAWPGSYRWIPECPFHRLTGLLCPGCGSLRALHCLMTGGIGEAFRCNALLVPALLLVLAGLSSDLARPGGGLFSAGSRASRIAGTGFLIATVLYTILRNLPLASAEWLGPG